VGLGVGELVAEAKVLQGARVGEEAGLAARAMTELGAKRNALHNMTPTNDFQGALSAQHKILNFQVAMDNI
jgi:hypothetical protein